MSTLMFGASDERIAIKVCILIAYSTLSPAVLAQDREHGTAIEDTHAIFRALADADRRLFDEYSTVFEMQRPGYHDPKQGMQVSRSALFSSQGVVILVVENKYSGDPVYRDPGTFGYQEMDFDVSGNLIVWRSLGKKAISTPERNRVCDLQEMSLVAPNGRIVKQVVHSQVYEYPIGSPNSIYEAAQFQLAVGRGFSKHLSAAKSEAIGRGTLSELLATGTFGPALPGEWTLQVERGEDHLVRLATFHAQGSGELAVQVETKGIFRLENALPLAASGTLHFGRVDKETAVEVRIIDFDTRIADREQFTRLRKELSDPIPEGTEVIDYTGAVPRRYTTGRHGGK